MNSSVVALDDIAATLFIGSLAVGLERLAALQHDCDAPLPVISDEWIWGLHGNEIRDRFDAVSLLIPRGEGGKSWSVLESLLHKLAELDVRRDSPIVALGGGSVGDVAGLASALFKRGCPVVQIPTTLLAQADSAIGGKTAIDFAGQKNLVGAFHAPVLVLADPSLLATLDARQLRAGFAEVVKYGVIGDPAFFAWCEANGEMLLAGHVERLSHAIRHSADAKARIVARDSTDRTGERALLNFGHSFGHAIEAAAGIGTVLHGEAVAIGMVLALRFSAALGLCGPREAERLSLLLANAGLPTTLAQVQLKGEALLDHLNRDKKNLGLSLTLVLARGIGQAFVQPAVPRERLAAFLAAA